MKYYLFWCGVCSGEIKESPPHLIRIPKSDLNLKICDCCKQRYAIWQKEVNEKAYYDALKWYERRMM